MVLQAAPDCCRLHMHGLTSCGLDSGDAIATARRQRRQRVLLAQSLAPLGLSWSDIDGCPAWVGWTDADRDGLCVSAGAWWLAASMRACIDGKRLARVSDLLGQEGVAALRASPVAARADLLRRAPRPLLPPADLVPEYLMAWGRALLGWSLQPVSRERLLAHLGWRVDEGHYGALGAHRDWAEHALSMAIQPVPPVAKEETVSVPEALGGDPRREENNLL